MREIDEALRIAERSGDDYVLGLVRYTLGFALVHRDAAADRQRGLELLAQVRDMCLHERFYISNYRPSNLSPRGRGPGAATAMVPSR